MYFGGRCLYMRARCYINSVFRRHWCLNNIRPQPQNLARIGLRRLLWAFLASAPEPSQNRPQEAPFEPFWPQPRRDEHMTLCMANLKFAIFSLDYVSVRRLLLGSGIKIWRYAWRTWSSQFFHWTTFGLQGWAATDQMPCCPTRVDFSRPQTTHQPLQVAIG